MENSFLNRLLRLKQKIRKAEYLFERRSGLVQLIAISKAQSLETIRFGNGCEVACFR